MARVVADGCVVGVAPTGTVARGVADGCVVGVAPADGEIGYII